MNGRKALRFMNPHNLCLGFPIIMPNPYKSCPIFSPSSSVMVINLSHRICDYSSLSLLSYSSTCRISQSLGSESYLPSKGHNCAPTSLSISPSQWLTFNQAPFRIPMNASVLLHPATGASTIKKESKKYHKAGISIYAHQAPCLFLPRS